MTEDDAAHDRDEVRRPAGEVYDWVSRGRDLLAGGHAGAAATLLRHAHEQAPGSRELTETLARAEFEAGRFGEARGLFAALVDLAPDSDYARFGLGASLVRLGRYRDALPHLTMATVMRPGRAEYEQLLGRARDVTAKDGSGTDVASRDQTGTDQTGTDQTGTDQAGTDETEGGTT